MWISNVATTAMMIPIAQAVLDELFIEEEVSSKHDCIHVKKMLLTLSLEPKDT